MKMKTIITSFLILLASISIAQTEINAYPSNWWIGMKNPTLQLMLHANTDLPKSIKINKTGVIIQKIFQPENKHYLFVDLTITPSAIPGKYTLTFDGGKTIQYELRNKSTPSPYKVNQGIYASDLMYLIMPDRFVNGDSQNDQFSNLRDKDIDRKNPYVRHGGDLAGVTQKLDYLKNLGITSIWMTPLLENDMPKMQEGPYTMSGYHGYWITDHYKIDQRFGGNVAYKNMVQSAHEKGLKVIQDAVYNHVGSFHHTVLDLPMKDWLNQWPSYTGSNHREELFIDPHASTDEMKIMIGGWFVPHLPDLNLANPYCAKFIIQSNIWSTQEFGIDGWRVDTYKYCDEKFLNKINAALIKEFPAITVFGEAWTNSVPASAYFTQNNMDVPFKHNIKGVTDFPLNAAIYDAINQPFGWTEGISKLYMTLSQDFLYKDPMSNCIFLDNHDMNRFYSMVQEDISKYKMGIGLLFTLRGIPQVYYGTESLARNFKNPNDAAVRKDFPGGWEADSVNKFETKNLDNYEKEAFSYFQKLANFRKSSLAISKGSLKQFIPQNGVYVYFRIHEKQTLMCVVNTNQSDSDLMLNRFSEVNAGVKSMKDVINEKIINSNSSIKIPSKSFQLFELIK